MLAEIYLLKLEAAVRAAQEAAATASSSRFHAASSPGATHHDKRASGCPALVAYS
jgi:hypothetical protein